MSHDIARALPFFAVALVAGGIVVALTHQAEFRRRWCSWLVAAPLLLVAALNHTSTLIFVSVLAAVAAFEYGRLTGLRVSERIIIAAGCPVLALVPLGVNGISVLLAAAVVVPLIGRDATTSYARAAATLFGLMWIALPLALLGRLSIDLVPVAAAVSFGDVAAFTAGKLLGRLPVLRRRLSPLSPNKTWAGVLGYAVVSVAVLSYFGDLGLVVVIGVLIGGVAGDLLESMVKRSAGVKDAGAWLPGFGGLLDRIDSLLGAAGAIAVGATVLPVLTGAVVLVGGAA